MHLHLDLLERAAGLVGKRARQVRMAAMMVIIARQKMVCVWIAAGADHIMDRAAEFIHAVPSQRVLDDRRHRAQIRQVRPHALAGGDVGAVYGAGLSRIETLVEIVRVPQVEIAHLRAFDRTDPEKAAGGHMETAALARLYQHLAGLGRAGACRPVEAEVRRRQRAVRIDDDRLDSAACVGVAGGGGNFGYHVASLFSSILQPHAGGRSFQASTGRGAKPSARPARSHRGPASARPC